MLFHNASQRQINLGLAVLRIVVGVVFVMHGGQKLFVYGFDGVAGAFAQMGVPMASLLGPLVALVEFLGGIALIAGLLTRLAGFALAVDMAVAIGLVHASAGFFLPNGYEFALSLLSGAVALTLTGAGQFSLDALIAQRIEEPAVQLAETRARRVA